MSEAQVIHVVLVTWREALPADVLPALERLTGDLRGGIPGIIEVTTGPSTSPEGLEQGYQWALVVRFVDAASRDGYLDHPVHEPVKALIGEWAASVLVYDVAAGS